MLALMFGSLVALVSWAWLCWLLSRRIKARAGWLAATVLFSLGFLLSGILMLELSIHSVILTGMQWSLFGTCIYAFVMFLKLADAPADAG